MNASRHLEEKFKLESLYVTCKFKNGVKSDEPSGFDYNGAASEIINGMELGPSNEIGGLPDETDPIKLPITVDYSNPDNLKIIDNIPK